MLIHKRHSAKLLGFIFLDALRNGEYFLVSFGTMQGNVCDKEKMFYTACVSVQCVSEFCKSLKKIVRWKAPSPLRTSSYDTSRLPSTENSLVPGQF